MANARVALPTSSVYEVEARFAHIIVAVESSLVRRPMSATSGVLGSTLLPGLVGVHNVNPEFG